MCFWPIENKHSFADAAVRQLASAIRATALGLPSLAHAVPLSWLRVHDELHKLAAEGSPCVRREEVCTLAAQCGLPHPGLALDAEVLYTTTLYCTILHCTLSYFTILYCTVLYCHKTH